VAQSKGPEVFFHPLAVKNSAWMTQMMKSSKTCQFLGIHLVKPTWKTQKFCRFNSETIFQTRFIFGGPNY
jgi:hypothetical protein